MDSGATIGHNKPPEGIDAVIACLRDGDDITLALNKLEADQTKDVDLETDKGRKEIASRSYAVSQMKTKAEEAGKAMVSEWKGKAKVVDQKRATIRTRLDEIRDKIRKPLTDWEDAEESRKEDLIRRLDALDAGRADALCPIEQIKTVLAEIEATPIDETWGEYITEAEIKKASAIKSLTASLDTATIREAEQAELAELRAAKEKSDREETDRVEAHRIAAENERLGKEAKKKAEAEAQAAIDVEKKRAEDAELAAKKAEDERKEAAEKAEADKIAAAEQAEKDKLEAIKLAENEERNRQARIAETEREAKEKRAADKDHRDRISKAITDAITSVTGQKDAQKITDAIFSGSIPHLEVKL